MRSQHAVIYRRADYARIGAAFRLIIGIGGGFYWLAILICRLVIPCRSRRSEPHSHPNAAAERRTRGEQAHKP